MIVTAAHVAEAMKLSIQDWKPLEIADEHGSQFIAARVERLTGDQAEKLAVIELQRTVLIIRTREPLVPEDQVMTLVYPEGFPHFVRGRLVQSVPARGLRAQRSWKCTRATLSIAVPREHRWSIATAASLLSLVTCSPRCLPFVSRQIRISTAWGTPNVVSVPVQVLEDYLNSIKS
jgi:hypothetical protein